MCMHVCTNLLEYAPVHRHNYMSVCVCVWACVGMQAGAGMNTYICVHVCICMSEMEHEMSNDR